MPPSHRDVAPELRPLDPADAGACDAVIASLPYHFGDAAGRAACARAVRSSPRYVARIGDDVVGFLTWRSWYAASAEITWMAVRADCRRQGIGGRLVEELAAGLPGSVRYLVVTTLSSATLEPGRADGYAGTRRFYVKHGFDPVWDPEGWWNTDNQAVVMVRALRPPLGRP